MVTPVVRFVSQLREGVDDQTEDDVQQDDVDDDEEGEVDENLEVEVLTSIIGDLECVGYASSKDQA